ncbi:MAG: hypothetical protein JEZ14_21550 [Marinilabiliaceae bacterium]|nr:hypothetical protein [Marinilabiliaceae bacterium]
MESNDIQELWAKYNEKLDQHLKFNSNLLRKINLDKSKKEFNKSFSYEIINLSIAIIIVIITGGRSFQYLDNMPIYLSFILSALLGITYSTLSIIKIQKFSKINFYSNASIINYQKQLADLRKTVLKYKKIELFLMPLLLITLLPVASMLAHNVNIFNDLTRFITTYIICLIICYPAALWLYKQLYENKLQNIMTFLDEIAEYEKSESEED